MDFYSGLLLGWLSMLGFLVAASHLVSKLTGPHDCSPKPSPRIGPGNWYAPSLTEPPIAGYQPDRPEGVANVPPEDLISPTGRSGIVRPADRGSDFKPRIM